MYPGEAALLLLSLYSSYYLNSSSTQTLFNFVSQEKILTVKLARLLKDKKDKKDRKTPGGRQVKG